jgi:hypothetical protein
MEYHSKLLFLEHILGSAKFSSGTKEAEFFCGFCKHYKRKLSVNLETNHWQCWVCGASGRNLNFLVRKFGTAQDYAEYRKKFEHKKIIFKELTEEEINFKPELPEEFTPIVNCRDSMVGKRALDYLTKTRGVLEEDILRHKIGITFTDQYRDSVIFPSFDRRGFLNFYTVRYFNGRKWSVEVPKGYKNQIILNELNVDLSKPVVVVEGFVDLLKSIDNTVPLFGSFLSTDSVLFNRIVRNKTDVILALDSDAQKKAHKIARSFMKYDVSCYIVDVSPYGDLGEMTKEEAKIRCESASLLNKERIFVDKLRALC